MTVSDWVDVGMLIMTFAGGCLALVQWRNSNRIRRAEFVNQLLDRLRFDEKLIEAMKTIEYEDDWYSEDFHNNKNNEHNIDALLSYLSYICYLKKMKVITDKEFNVYSYQVTRTCRSSSVEEYLWNLYHFAIKNKTKSSFKELIEYGKNYKIFDGKFDDSSSDLYNRYLNF